MKARQLFLLTGIALASVLGCKPSGKDVKTEVYGYADSTAHASLTMDVELPVAVKGAAGAIREQLLQVLDGQVSFLGSYENERQFPAYSGDTDDTEALMAYYQQQALSLIGRLSQEDYDERVESVWENDGWTDEEKAEILDGMPGWEYAFSLRKTCETPRYVVFLSEDYVYLGGAHGGVIGCGPLTFDKQDGHQVTVFVNPEKLDDIQPLLRQGLTGYFSESGETVSPESLDDWLQLDGDRIPLPAWAPFPTEEGLVFTYQQYEIASYAAGMPNFVLSYDDVLPYLSDEAKKLLSL